MELMVSVVQSLAQEIESESTANPGSMMTNVEEGLALAQNPASKDAIESYANHFYSAVQDYQSGIITYEQLQANVSLLGIINTLQGIISADTTDAIKPIEQDLGTSQAEYTSHLKVILGLAQTDLKIPAYKAILPPNNTYENLLPNGDFSHGKTGWTNSGSGTLKVNPPGTYDATSPVANKSSLSFMNSTGKAGAFQTINTTAS